MSASFWDRVEAVADSREANVETWLVVPLLEALGHDLSCIDAKVPVEFQQGRQKRRGRKPEADFVVYAERPFSRTNSLIVVEVKRSDETLDDGKEQGESYAQSLRAPILMVTNGLRFQLWQMQTTAESARVLDCDVADLAARRGEIEAILSREAIKEYSSKIYYKHFDILARDLGVYERAQYERALPETRNSLIRTLRESDGKRNIDPFSLVFSENRGAVIVGPSGYGKTTLAGFFLRECLERRWEDMAAALPIGVFLPDVVLSGRTFEEFFVDRIASYKPGFALSTLHKIAREQGLLVIADGFERVAPERRAYVEGALRTLLADYPLTRLIVMSRAQVAPSGLDLPVFHLSGFDIQELRELARLRSIVHPEVAHVFAGAPDQIYRIGEVPLLADLIIDRYARERKYVADIPSLYEEWLNRILSASRPFERALDRQLLEDIAIATSAGPITLGRAIELCRSHPNPERTLNSLVEADALSVHGTSVELQHEGLADYLRALRFWNGGQDYRKELSLVPLDISSQFPFLLVATAPTADARGETWLAIVRANMHLAVRTLHFAAGDETFGSDAEGDAKRLLADIQSTIETLVTVHLQPIGDLIRKEIAGIDIERLGIRGNMNGDFIAYSFFEAQDKADALELVPAVRWKGAPKMYGHALRRVGYGPEAGRIIGTERVQVALASLRKKRWLRGGRVWIEERVFGRLRHLEKEHDAAVSNSSLQIAYDTLKPAINTWVGPSSLRNGQIFRMRELLDDIAILIEEGTFSITPWWDDFDALDFRSAEGQSRFARTLNEYHRRRQSAYAEIVELSLPALAPYLQTFRMMPFRYEVEAELYTRNGFERPAINYRRWPVQTFDEAGADVSFPAEMSDWDSDEAGQSYVDRTDVLLKRFGRWFEGRSIEWGSSSQMLDLHGRTTSSDGLPDESVVVRGVMAWLKKDLERLFSEMPIYRTAY